MSTLIFTDGARENLTDIGHFIANSSSAKTAEAFVASLVAKCTKLASLSGTLGTARPELDATFRSTPYKGYIIYFRYIDDRLEVLGVLNARRDAAAFFADDSSEP